MALFAPFHYARLTSAHGTFRPIDRREPRSAHWGIADHSAAWLLKGAVDPTKTLAARFAVMHNRRVPRAGRSLIARQSVSTRKIGVGRGIVMQLRWPACSCDASSVLVRFVMRDNTVKAGRVWAVVRAIS
jgi:hypothetical protein